MPAFDIQALLWGFLAGVPVSILFFWGLDWGMRRALHSRHPGLLLTFSFFVRAAVLLGLGLWLASKQNPLWTSVAYLVAFGLVRFVMVKRVKNTLPVSSADAGSTR